MPNPSLPFGSLSARPVVCRSFASTFRSSARPPRGAVSLLMPAPGLASVHSFTTNAPSPALMRASIPFYSDLPPRLGLLCPAPQRPVRRATARAHVRPLLSPMRPFPCLRPGQLASTIHRAAVAGAASPPVSHTDGRRSARSASSGGEKSLYSTVRDLAPVTSAGPAVAIAPIGYV